ncbi:unnamed protein product [Calypogeia fissa]
MEDRKEIEQERTMSCSMVCDRDMEDQKEIDFEMERTGPFTDSSSTSTSDAANQGPAWANLNPDALAEVFSRLPFEDRMRTLPLVCKGWRNASSYPVCWMYLDFQDWFQKRADKDYLWEFDSEPTVERLVMKAVDMSGGQLRELRTRYCTDAAVDYIADRCPSLTVLAIPNSLSATDRSITKLAAKCSKLQELDLSDCYNISNQALEAVGRQCKSLVWLGRNMLQKRNDPSPITGPIPGGDEEAIVVSKHMGKLKHLEMKRTSLSDRGLAHLARGCGELESLNLACCTAISPKALARVTEKCPNIVDFTKPIAPRMHVDSQRLRILFG